MAEGVLMVVKTIAGVAGGLVVFYVACRLAFAAWRNTFNKRS